MITCQISVCLQNFHCICSISGHTNDLILKYSRLIKWCVVFVRLAFLYSLLRNLILCLILVVIHGGSPGRIRVSLLGM